LELVQGLLPALTAIGTAGWIAYTYFAGQEQTRANEATVAQRENATRVFEAQKSFSQKQLQLYAETGRVLGRLVSADDTMFGKDDWKKDARRFEALYWAELSMVEDEGVKQAMINFRPVLLSVEQKSSVGSQDRVDLQNATYRVAKALNASIASTWEVPLSEVNLERTKICIAERASSCPAGSQTIDCSNTIAKWVQDQKCLKHSISDVVVTPGGKCGVQVANILCTKKKSS
jgi:hypothetical protein